VIRGTGVLLPKDRVDVLICVDGEIQNVSIPEPAAIASESKVRLEEPFTKRNSEAPDLDDKRLIDYAVARSGDKGSLINIGVIARDAQAWEYIRRHLTAGSVASWLEHLGASRVERFELSGSRSLNFVLHDVLEGGGMVNLRYDAQGKAVAQMLLDMPLGKNCLKSRG